MDISTTRIEISSDGKTASVVVDETGITLTGVVTLTCEGVHDANGIRFHSGKPKPGIANRVQTLCGDPLCVVLRLFPFDLLTGERCGVHARSNGFDLYGQLRSAFTEAGLHIGLAHDMPAMRIEHQGREQALVVEVLVVEGAPLAERVAKLAELVEPLGYRMSFGHPRKFPTPPTND